MSLSKDPALDPTPESKASGDLRPAGTETELVTNPKGQQHDGFTESSKPPTYIEMASNATASATNVASGMTSNVFSMFGGGAKKERKEEPEDDCNEPSGSSKVKKTAEDPEVSSLLLNFRCTSRVNSLDYSRIVTLTGRSPGFARCSLRACCSLD